jgi:ribosomal protein S18 acetylase RimI-like enzyme
MRIETSASTDVGRIFELYDEAIDFQKQVFDKHWLGFDRELVDREIAEGGLWKIVEEGDIACVFSIVYEDPILWGANSGDRAMYIHRIVTASEFRGRGYVKAITNWAKQYACENNLRFVRMDTWADNQKLLDYYQACGFKFIGLISPAESDTLPPHYKGLTLSLLEIDLENDKASF